MAKQKREVQEINASSMADISFLLLVFFLVSTSMATDEGLSRQLPPPKKPNQEQKEVDIKPRNFMQILVNSDNDLMVNGDVMPVSELKTRAKEFIANRDNAENLPELSPDTINFFGVVNVTKQHVISLQNDRGTSYAAYIAVQNELVAAYDELREELARSKFQKSYEECSKEEQKAIRDYYPQRISEAEPKNYGGGND